MHTKLAGLCSSWCGGWLSALTNDRGYINLVSLSISRCSSWLLALTNFLSYINLTCLSNTQHETLNLTQVSNAQHWHETLYTACIVYYYATSQKNTALSVVLYLSLEQGWTVEEDFVYDEKWMLHACAWMLLSTIILLLDWFSSSNFLLNCCFTLGSIAVILALIVSSSITICFAPALCYTLNFDSCYTLNMTFVCWKKKNEQQVFSVARNTTVYLSCFPL